MLSIFSQSFAVTVTWDANAATALQTDGAGAWLTANQWWNGSSNVTWASGDDAVFGNGGTGGAVTLASETTVGSITFNSFTGTYTLGTAGSRITLNNGITMNSGAGAATIISPITLGGAQSWTNHDDSLLTIGTGAVTNAGYLLTIGGTGNTTVSSAIGGSGGLTKSGSGNLTLSGANTFSGVTTVSAGTLTLSNSTALQNSVLDTNTSIAGNASNGLNTTETTLTLGGLTGSKDFAASGGVFTTTSSGYGSVTALTLNAQSGVVSSYSGVIADGATGMTLTKSGTGTQDLSGANTYTGATTVTGGASSGQVYSVLNVSSLANGGSNSSIGASSSAAGNLILNNGTLRYTGGAVDTDRLFSLQGRGILQAAGTGAINFTNTGSMGFNGGTAARTLVLAGGNMGNNTLAAMIGDNVGATSLEKWGPGVWVLSGANSYTGSTMILTGTLRFANMTSLYSNVEANWTANKINVKNNATLALNVDSAGSNGFSATKLDTLLTNISVANATTTGLQSGAILGIDTSTATGGTFTQGNAIANSTGSSGGAIGLSKLGTGTLILDKTNTYTGATSVLAGKLLVHGSTSASSNFTVNNGATLGGSGTIGGTVTLMSGATLSPGASIESLGLGSNTWNGGSTVQVEFSTDGSAGAAGTQWDLINITGTLDLTGASSSSPITLDLVSMLNATNAGSLAVWDGNINATWAGFVTTTGGITGFAADKFAFDTTQFLNTLNGTFNVTQNGNNLNLNYVTNYVIPEPRAALMGSIGLLLLLRRRR